MTTDVPGLLAAASVDTEALLDLYARFRDAHRDGASSNDIVQLLDEWFRDQGFPSVLCGTP